MQLNQEVPEFSPVVIELETREEAERFLSIINAVSRKEPDDIRNMRIEISGFFANYVKGL